MGLFDDTGDMSSLLDYLNPVGTANAGVPMPPTGGITPEQLLNSTAAQNPINQVPPVTAPIGTPPAPPMTPPAPPPVTPPIVTRAVGQAPVVNDPTAAQGPFRIDQPTTAPPPSIDETTMGAPANPPPGAVGAALLPPPTNIVPPGATSPTDVSGAAKAKAEANANLATALRGVKAPDAPVVQKIASPSAPRPTSPIRSGNLQALLQLLNAGQARPLPVTLGR